MSEHGKKRMQPQPDAVAITLAGGRRAHENLLLDGRLIVRTPHGLKPQDCLLIEATDEFPAGRIMAVAMNVSIPALALSALRPHAAVTFYHFDLFHTRQAESLAGAHRLLNFTALCQSDVPALDPAPDLMLAEFRTDGEAGLTLELIRQAHARLTQGGKLLCVINNPRDQWLRHQLEKTFGNLTQVARDKYSILYSVKRIDHPTEASETPSAHYTKHVEVGFQDWHLDFETCYGTFSSGSLDDGTRALLEVLEPPAPCRSILDLGCGWGAMGILAARKGQAEHLVMTDSNARAIEMAHRNAERLGPAQAEVYLETDVESIQGGAHAGQFDLVVTNPPYGTDYRVLELFITMAWRALRPGGQVYIVGKNNPRMVAKTEEVFGAAEVLRRRGYAIVKAIRPDTRVY